MKLIMFSGNITNKISKYIKELSNDNPTLTIIPSDSKHPKIDIFIESLKNTFEKHGVKKINYYPVDTGFFNENIYEESDIIYLSGGDTGTFLGNLKSNGDFDKLKEFVSRGGLLMGLSAGSIIMTPNIGTDNSNEEGLNLVDFEFFPHYSSINNNFLLEYSQNTGNIIYGVPDNSCIIIDGNDINFIGGEFIYMFKDGKNNKLI